jgi:DNA-binding MarR family transcriptional regulator
MQLSEEDRNRLEALDWIEKFPPHRARRVLDKATPRGRAVIEAACAPVLINLYESLEDPG